MVESTGSASVCMSDGERDGMRRTIAEGRGGLGGGSGGGRSTRAGACG